MKKIESVAISEKKLDAETAARSVMNAANPKEVIG
jgi:hypothetical protein